MREFGLRQNVALTFVVLLCLAATEKAVAKTGPETASTLTPFTERFIRMTDAERLALLNHLADIYRSERDASKARALVETQEAFSGPNTVRVNGETDGLAAALDSHLGLTGHGTLGQSKPMESFDTPWKRRAGGKLCYINPIACFGRRQRQAPADS